MITSHFSEVNGWFVRIQGEVGFRSIILSVQGLERIDLITPEIRLDFSILPDVESDTLFEYVDGFPVESGKIFSRYKSPFMSKVSHIVSGDWTTYACVPNGVEYDLSESFLWSKTRPDMVCYFKCIDGDHWVGFCSSLWFQLDKLIDIGCNEIEENQFSTWLKSGF